MNNAISIKTPNINITFWQHAIFWVVIYLSYSFLLSFYGPFSRYLIANLVNVGLFMLTYYTLRQFQIPYLFKRKKWVLFVVSLIIMSFILFGIYALCWELFIKQVLNREGIYFLNLSGFLVKTIRFYSPALLLLTLESHHLGKKEKQRIQALEKEKLANELKFLKAQINPHFLFNTLNNLYSYVVTESPKAPDMILRLSGILDYVFNKSQNKFVQLYEEIDTIKNFLGLEQIRYGDRLLVNFESSGKIDQPISPLILLSIVENAFKHGASGDIENPKINIEIRGEQNSIFCKVWNTKSKHQGELNDAYKKGIGLSNIKRQLDLVYPNQHELVIEDQDQSFNLSLKITTKK